MGLGPSKPSVQELSILTGQVDACTAEIADAIRRADVLLLCTGAGFSADSGLATYEDVAGVKAYQDLGYKYHNICRPEWLSHDPEVFYGFWGACFNDYRQTQPHDGYAIVRKWRDARFASPSSSRVARSIRMAIQEANSKANPPAVPPAYKIDGAAGAFYVYTSNVDGHSYDFFGPEEVRECHGNTEVWQCGAMPPCCKQTFRAPEKFKFAVDMKKMRAPAKRSSVTPAMEQPADPTEGSKARVGRVNRPFGQRQQPLQMLPEETRKEASSHVDSAFRRRDANWPSCPFCNGHARPRVLMFNDTHWVSDSEQERRFHLWKEVVVDVGRSLTVSNGRMMRVLILEIGCGGTVPTVRTTCESTAVQLKTAANVTVARINPDFPLPDRLYPPSMNLRFLSVPMGALEGLRKVNNHYMEMTTSRRPQAKRPAQEVPTSSPAAKTAARSRSPKGKVKEEKAEKKQLKKEEEEVVKEEDLDSQDEAKEEPPAKPARRGAAKAKAKAKASARQKQNNSRCGRLSPIREKQPPSTPARPHAAPRSQTKSRASTKAAQQSRNSQPVIRTLD